jgi:hypothetical protein
MTVTELRDALARYPHGYEVVVAGDARLALVTHGGSVDGRRVVVLYVAEPELEQARSQADPLPEGQLELPG